MNDERPTQYRSIHPSISYRAWYSNQSVSQWFHSNRDINDLFLKCSNYTDVRREMLRNLSEMNVQLPTNMLQILRQNNIGGYRGLMKYVKATKILI